MCEYSLRSIPNRLAVDGEQLVTHRFPTQSIGLCAGAEIEATTCAQTDSTQPISWWSKFKNWLSAPQRLNNLTAVCIPPGARLQVSQLPRHIRREFNLGSVEEVTFVELSAEAYQYRDAIQFRTGKSLLLQYFDEGVRLKVLSLASSEPETPEMETEWAWRPQTFA
jgi:hypothetical protein